MTDTHLVHITYATQNLRFLCDHILWMIWILTDPQIPSWHFFHLLLSLVALYHSYKIVIFGHLSDLLRLLSLTLWDETNHISFSFSMIFFGVKMFNVVYFSWPLFVVRRSGQKTVMKKRLRTKKYTWMNRSAYIFLIFVFVFPASYSS